MTDLSRSIAGQRTKDIADYFSTSIKNVENAILDGSKTYQDIDDYLSNVNSEGEIHPDLVRAISCDDWETICKFMCVHDNESEKVVLKRGFVQGWKECRRFLRFLTE